MPKKKVLIIEPDKLNEDILETFLNIRNNHADRIKYDYTVTMEGKKPSSLNSKKATKLIKGESPDKIKKTKFTCQLSSNVSGQSKEWSWSKTSSTSNYAGKEKDEGYFGNLLS